VASREAAEPVVSKAGKSSKNNSLRAAGTVKTVHHKVQKGETLTSIAEEYNTSVDALRRANHMDSSQLRAGDVLIVTAGQ
jgi:N-acetylmuramoyl-L-alanine amidase